MLADALIEMIATSDVADDLDTYQLDDDEQAYPAVFHTIAPPDADLTKGLVLVEDAGGDTRDVDAGSPTFRMMASVMLAGPRDYRRSRLMQVAARLHRALHRQTPANIYGTDYRWVKGSLLAQPPRQMGTDEEGFPVIEIAVEAILDVEGEANE